MAHQEVIGYAVQFVIPGASSKFKYGPFRNHPKRDKPSKQSLQRRARRIERMHRK